MPQPQNIVFRRNIGGISLEHIKCLNSNDVQARHFHDEYEVLYFLKGQRLIFLKNRSYLAQTGDILIIDSDAIHMTRCPPGAEPDCECVIFYITSGKMKELDGKFPGLELVRYFARHTGIYRVNEKYRKQFMRLNRFFQRECQNMAYGYGEIVESAVLWSLVRMVRELNISEPVPPVGFEETKNKRTYEIAEYMSENIDAISSLDELAKRFDISKFYMCRVFKEVTGYTILEYLTILKIQQARRYLADSDMNISQIAKKVGYNSLTHFEKEFKRYMHMSPTSCRKADGKAARFAVTTGFPQDEVAEGQRISGMPETEMSV